MPSVGAAWLADGKFAAERDDAAGVEQRIARHGLVDEVVPGRM